MRKITSFILALALTLSLLVTAGAADPGKVDLVITPRAEKVNGSVLFDIYLEPNKVTEIAAFQFAVTAQGGKIVGVAYLNNGKYTEDGTPIENPTNGGLVFYPDKVGATGFTNGYFEQFGGQRSSDDLTYKFVAAGTARAAYTDEDKNTSMPAHIWTTPTRTKIVTLTVQMDEGVTECSLAADTTTSSKFSVGNWGSNNTVSDNGTTGTATSTPYTPASPTGVTVRGTAVSWNNTDNAVYLLYPSSKSDADIKAEWKNGSTYTAAYVGTNGTIDNTTVDGKKMQEQSFTFTGVASGDYKLVIFKHGKYVPKIVPINVGASDYTCGQIKLWLYGDVNYDGKIRTGDATLIYSYLAGERNFSDDQYSAADITCDGKVRTGDATQIYLLLAGESSKFDNLKN